MKNERISFNRNLIPVVFTLAWPTMLQEMMDTAVQYIDTAMVGSLGTHATAAVGSTTTVNWLVGSSISAVGVGFLSYIARAYGAREKERAAKAAAQAADSAYAYCQQQNSCVDESQQRYPGTGSSIYFYP